MLPFVLKPRLFFSFFNMVSYSMNCMEGLLTCNQYQVELLMSLSTYKSHFTRTMINVGNTPFQKPRTPASL